MRKLAAIAIAALIAVCAFTAASAAETPIKIGVVSRTIFYLPTWTAEQQGFFKAEGLAPTIQIYNDSHKIFTDLKSGEIQIGISSIETVIEDGMQGGSMRLIAGSAQRPPHFIIAQPEIKSLADLKGKTIGVVSMHEGTTFFIKDIARKGGFALADVKVEAVGGSPARAKLLKERKIDAGLQPYPLSYEAEADGFSNLGPIADLVPYYQFTAVMAENGWASQHRAEVVGFLRALRKGTDYMFAHPDESAALGAKELRTTAANAKRALEDTVRMDVLARDLSLNDTSLQTVFATMQEAGVMPADARYDRSKFVDESYLNESRR
jgi:ABC-type nitrate/sulfonate/bicarbonate transport system substrate-binding protein